MQDRTIDNALLALHKEGGTQAKLAEVLLELRGVDCPAFYQDNSLTRGGTKRFILAQLYGGPKSCADMADALQANHPNISRLSTRNRLYQALRRLEDFGRVTRHDGVWRLAP